MNDKTLWFASNNEGKIKELKAIFEPEGYTINSLLDLTISLDINEIGVSFVENAILKATTLAKVVKCPVIGDDSGLEILALNNFPGIYSARWKDQMTYHEAMLNILQQMQDETNRAAWFICALAYVDLEKNITKTFIGKLDGEITTTIKGNHGFGYDQIFYVPSLNATLSEIMLVDKNKISHRWQAISQLLTFLKDDK